MLFGASPSAESSTGQKTPVAAAVTHRGALQAAAGERLAAQGPWADPDHMADAVVRLCHTLQCFNDQLGSLGLD